MSDAEQFFRPEINSLPTYGAGKNSSDPQIIKVASNEMPFPTLAQVQAALAGALGGLNVYPDASAACPIEEIAHFHSVSPQRIAVSNGSVAAIEKILSAVCTQGSEVIMPWRSFEAYPITIQLAGAVAKPVALRADGNNDLRAMLGAITPRTRAVLICTPNNPTSAALTHSEVRDFIARVPGNIPVLLDEAYVDFVEMDDPVRGIELTEQFPNLIDLRTFSKAYSLAGIRCGYMIASEDVIATIRKAATPFEVNALAQVAARSALQSRSEVERRVSIIKRERTNLQNALHALGWEIPTPQGNFVWFNFGVHSSLFAQICLEHGIIVRPFEAEGVRVTIGEPEAQLRLLRALAEFRSRTETD
ncbi:MAG: histidinol-phosphate transaminase [Actinomycetaceae bacterium]|nr:histidinol-phosphate transaminase [Arcanobacterium sp.]MDD7505663.1 histidinol-phosphate transaminase [Actinomycetaceae bacterium]MDY6143448.1 histidinol-phosphate transaminase [Arcanobacterium sp.]